MKLSSILGGLAGAVALTLINQGVKKVDKTSPRLDLLGMNVAAKLFKRVNGESPAVDKLFAMSLAGDLISNSLYYGMASSSTRQKTLLRGALLGLGAGIGAVGASGALGVNPQATNLTTKTKGLTVAWYVIGGLVAAGVMNAIDNATEKPAVKELTEPVKEFPKKAQSKIEKAGLEFVGRS
jgi:hypothetical protein